MSQSLESTQFSLTKFPFDPAKVGHMVPLLAVLAGVLWAFSVAWFLASESSDERIAAGIVAGLLFIGLLVSVITLSRISPRSISGASDSPADSPSKVARDLVQSPLIDPKDVETTKLIVGKNQDYVIVDPRPYWSVRWTSFEQFLVEETGISDKAFIDALGRTQPGIDFDSEVVLNIYSNVKYEIEMVPGKSKINGLPTMSLYHAPVSAQLIVLPFHKYSSNRGDSETLITFAIETIAGTLGSSAVRDFRSGRRPDGSSAVVVELEEVIDDVVINGVGDQSMRTKIAVVCLESITKYYSIVLTYPEGAMVVASDIQRLQEIAESFRLVQPVDPKAKTEAARTAARERRRSFIESNAAAIMRQNFIVLRGRLTALNLNNERDLQKATSEVGRLLKLGESIRDDQAPSEWKELEAAWQKGEEGDPSGLIEVMRT